MNNVLSTALPGIYAIRCLADGVNTTYIGQASKAIAKRWNMHKFLLDHGEHHNSHLQRAWDKYGKHSFEFVILENVSDVAILIEREQFWLDATKSRFPVYNTGEIADSPGLGNHMSEEAKQRLREQRVGKKLSDAHRKKLSESHMGHGQSETTKKKISVALRKRVRKKETYIKIGNALRGKPRPDWVIEKVSLASKKPFPSLINTHTLEIIPAGRGLTKVCEEMGLAHSGMQNVARGISIQNKGWILYDMACIL